MDAIAREALLIVNIIELAQSTDLLYFGEKQMLKLISLSLLRVNELGQDAFTAHENCMRRVEKPDDIEVTRLSVKCKTVLENQHKWIDAIREALHNEKT